RREVNGEKRVRVPEGLWIKCSYCGDIIYRKELERNLEVCLKCNCHFRISPAKRLSIIMDKGTFTETGSKLAPIDPLGFKDIKRYKDRLKDVQQGIYSKEAVTCGEGKIEGHRVVIGVFDFSFMGGSMGSVVGEKITMLFEKGIEQRCSVIILSSSGGARMQEGIFSLMQMAKTSAAIARYKAKSRCPYISILTDPTTGGVTASFAMLGDIIIAEPRALIGFAGPRVIEETIKQKLPEGFQRSEYLLEHGMIDMIVNRGDMQDVCGRILSLFQREPDIKTNIH
ncbi:MAG: acetyl-CoA carboxylase, carboxyltransferase subunit beta, partial [Thermodesulfobacteriota bacterium]